MHPNAAVPPAIALWLWIGALSVLACAGSGDPRNLRVAHGEQGAACSWFGHRHEDLLYFGISRYWADAQRNGASAALESKAPAQIGRFDLERETMRPPLPLNTGPTRGGVWDVHALDDGRVVYTGLAEHAAWVDPRSGTSEVLPGAGAGVNEIAAMPGGGIALTQYFAGSVLVYSSEGALEQTLPLAVPPGVRVAPKSIAFDPARGATGWLWVTTDLYPAAPDAAPRHDARAIDLETGRERLNVSTPELQNVAFDTNGRGYLVWSGARGLVLQILEPEDPPKPEAGRLLTLSSGFDATQDFAQDIAVEASGRVVITLWSGRVFVVERDRRVRSVLLPRGPPESLYYSAALRGERVCATRCAGVAVVCADLP